MKKKGFSDGDHQVAIEITVAAADAKAWKINSCLFDFFFLYIIRWLFSRSSVHCATRRPARQEEEGEKLLHHSCTIMLDWRCSCIHTHTDHLSLSKKVRFFPFPFSLLPSFFSFSSLLHPCNYRPVRRGLSHVSRLREAKARQCLAIHHLCGYILE